MQTESQVYEARTAAVATIEMLDAALVAYMKDVAAYSYMLTEPSLLRQELARCLKAMLAFRCH